MEISREETLLNKKGVRATANRILVLRTLLSSEYPMSLSGLEAKLETLDKSSIFRVLTLFLEHSIVHAIEDGSGSLKYEICSSDGECSISDMHVHFHCDSCHRTYCFEDTNIPLVNLPEGFAPHSINYMIKGECPECREKHT